MRWLIRQTPQLRHLVLRRGNYFRPFPDAFSPCPTRTRSGIILRVQPPQDPTMDDDDQAGALIPLPAPAPAPSSGVGRAGGRPPRAGEELTRVPPPLRRPRRP